MGKTLKNTILGMVILINFILASSQPKITLHAENSRLSTVLSILAEESGYNIVTGPNVGKEDMISIHLDNVDIEQAINLIIRASGLGYEIVGKSILVAEASKLKADVGVTSQVYDLQYANAQEVADLLVNLTDKITVDKTGNKLLVNASPKKLSEITEIITRVDIPALQIMLEAKLIEVTISKDTNIGIDWAKLAQISTVIAENALPITLPSGKATGAIYPGYNYGTDTNGDIYEETGTSYGSDGMPTMPFERIDPFGKGLPGFSRKLTAFDVTLDMMLKNNQAEILANSQVVTLNGKDAQIKMVDIFPYVLSSGGVGGQVQVQREEIGIKLQIQPTVNTDGYITTKVVPEVSSIYDFIGPDRTIPWVKKRESTTTIRVKDNESIIIAGLLSSDRSYAEDKVPLLWRIPYLGEKFFTHTVEKEKKTDLIIQITPRIIRDNYSANGNIDSGILKNQIHQNIENNSTINKNDEEQGK